MDALLLKVPEAAAQLGISRAKLYELISDGVLPSVRVDGCRRIRRDVTGRQPPSYLRPRTLRAMSPCHSCRPV